MKTLIIFFILISSDLLSADKTPAPWQPPKDAEPTLDLNSRHVLNRNLEVYSVAFVPGKKLLASYSADPNIDIWNYNTGKHRGTLANQDGSVVSFTVAPNGKYLATGSNDGFLKLWKLNGKLLLAVKESANWIRAVAISHDNKLLASSSGDGFKLWNTETGQMLKTFAGHQRHIVSTIAFPPDDGCVISGSWDGTIRFWDLHTGSLTKEIEDESHPPIDFIIVDPQGQYMAYDGPGYSTRIRSLKNQKVLATVEQTGPVNSAAFSHNGKYFTTGSSDTTVTLWDAKTKEPLKVFIGHSDRVNSVAFDSDDEIIASGSQDKTIRLWDVK